VSQAVRAVPANDGDATPIPLPSAPQATVEARVDACRDDVRRVERKLGEIATEMRESAAAARRRDESTRGAVAHNTDEIFRVSQTLAAMGAHMGLSQAELRRDARFTRALALVRIPALIAVGMLIMRVLYAWKGHGSP
jgi:hypothetical protein